MSTLQLITQSHDITRYQAYCGLHEPARSLHFETPDGMCPTLLCTMLIAPPIDYSHASVTCNDQAMNDDGSIYNVGSTPIWRVKMASILTNRCRNYACINFLLIISFDDKVHIWILK